MLHDLSRIYDSEEEEDTMEYDDEQERRTKRHYDYRPSNF